MKNDLALSTADVAVNFNLPPCDSLNSSATFNECTYLREIHLSGEYEASIRASSAWSSSDGKFGADNATISFDLPLTQVESPTAAD
ncbi:MAG: hypothetical protein KIH06_02970 [Kiritimatiellae bacterium]|nr:hypothetical protein [Kiritimatiellia bacterium]